MVTLGQHIIELEAERSVCSEPIERFKIEAELIAARHQRDRAEASNQSFVARARGARETIAPEAIYRPNLGLVSQYPRSFCRGHTPPWDAGQLAALLEELALELHLAHRQRAGAESHLRIALHQIDTMQRALRF
jgi:hypothetical protein